MTRKLSSDREKTTAQGADGSVRVPPRVISKAEVSDCLDRPLRVLGADDKQVAAMADELYLAVNRERRAAWLRAGSRSPGKMLQALERRRDALLKVVGSLDASTPAKLMLSVNYPIRRSTSVRQAISTSDGPIDPIDGLLTTFTLAIRLLEKDIESTTGKRGARPAVRPARHAAISKALTAARLPAKAVSKAAAARALREIEQEVADLVHAR